MKTRTAKLHENPLKVLLCPPLEGDNCLVISNIHKEEFAAVKEFITKAGFGVRELKDNEIAVFPMSDKSLKEIEKRVTKLEKEVVIQR